MNLVENWIYHVPSPPQRTRTKPMQIVALGMSRSGTESLRRALVILGYDHVFHGFDMTETTPMMWKAWTMLGRRKYGNPGPDKTEITRADLDVLLGHCEAVTDQPCAFFAQDLVRAYPEAKVILSVRDVDSWYASACKVFLPNMGGVMWHVLTAFNAQMYWAKKYTEDLFLAYFQGDFARNGKRVYEKHNATVRGLVPPERLLEWRVEDGWEPICRFLDKPIPQEEFPWGNSSDKTMDRYDQNMADALWGSLRNLGIFVVLSGALTAYVVRRFI